MISTLTFTVPDRTEDDSVIVFLLGCLPSTASASHDLHGEYHVHADPKDLPRIKVQVRQRFPSARFTTVFER